MILGVIPARGGSKGIPGKNTKMIAGKPLIGWTIEAAGQSQLLDRYVVSTEDKEISKTAERFGAHVLWRPPELAGDEVPMLEVLKHAVKEIPCKAVVLLAPTSPIRSKGLIDSCIKEFLDNDYDSLATGSICKAIEYAKDVDISIDGKELRRQDIPGFFYDDGNVYCIKADLIKNNDRYGRHIGRRVISRRENVDVDDDFDFSIAEKLLLDEKK